MFDKLTSALGGKKPEEGSAAAEGAAGGSFMDTAKAKAEAVTGDVEKSAGDIKEKITKTFTDEAEELKAKLSGTGTAAPAQEKVEAEVGKAAEGAKDAVEGAKEAVTSTTA